MASDCLSRKHKVQLSKAEVNKDTFAGSSPQPFQHRTATPSEVPYTQGSLHSRFEPPDVLSFRGRSPQRHTMRTGERRQGWAGGRTPRLWGLRVVSAGKGTPSPSRSQGDVPVIFSPPWEKRGGLGLGAAAAIAWPPASITLMAFHPPQKTTEDSVTRHRLLLAW